MGHHPGRARKRNRPQRRGDVRCRTACGGAQPRSSGAARRHISPARLCTPRTRGGPRYFVGVDTVADCWQVCAIRASFSHMKRILISRFRYLAALWLAGAVALACATWICLQLALNAAPTSFVYLIVIVLLSLMGSFISSALFSVIAVACLY